MAPDLTHNTHKETTKNKISECENKHHPLLVGRICLNIADAESLTIS